ncbi:hypothetical protein [Microbacterium lacticum]|uniref:hypothetical protein n=1 Tax=Microbacterium lacticum TaxID=33885 RepID=UPI001F5909C5|nr:hypothetical protein [Microbacterium lacticum]
MILRQALAAQSRSFARDVVLLGVGVAAFTMALSLITSVPAEISSAPVEVRARLLAPFDPVMATYGALMAAIYGSFRYTSDRRNGVVAQRLTVQPRWAHLAGRVPWTALGGGVIAVATVLGGRIALAPSLGGLAVDLSSTALAAALGATAALWGLSVGLLVQHHLIALFVAPLSLSVGLLLTAFWGPGAVWFPLPAMLTAFGFDLGDVALGDVAALDTVAAVAVVFGWSLVALVAGGASLARRDVH